MGRICLCVITANSHDAMLDVARAKYPETLRCWLTPIGEDCEPFLMSLGRVEHCTAHRGSKMLPRLIRAFKNIHTWITCPRRHMPGLFYRKLLEALKR